MNLSPATPVDADPLACLVNGAYRGKAAQAGWTAESNLLDGQRTDPATLRQTLADGRTTVLVARDEPGGPLVGCVSLEPTAADAAIWYLGMLTVSPVRQAGGLGRHLLAEAESFARHKGATRIRMTVVQQRSELVAWYERRGYARTGATEPFPYGDERFGIPLRDDLHFVVLEKHLSAAAPGSA